MSKDSFSSRFSSTAELKEVVGKEIGITEWLKIEQKNIDDFAKATLDQQWIHTDPELAKIHSPYGTTIAHGFLILSLAPKLLYEAMHIDDAFMGVNYGLDKVRFPHAAPVNCKVRAKVTLKKVEELPDSARLTLSVIFEIKGETKPACVADFIVLILSGENEDI